MKRSDNEKLNTLICSMISFPGGTAIAVPRGNRNHCRNQPFKMLFCTTFAIKTRLLLLLTTMATIQKINANPWLDKEAEQAANFYTSVFKNSRIGKISRYGKEGDEVHKMLKDTVIVIEFWLEDIIFSHFHCLTSKTGSDYF